MVASATLAKCFDSQFDSQGAARGRLKSEGLDGLMYEMIGDGWLPTRFRRT